MHGHGMFDNPDIFYLDRPNFQGMWELPDLDIEQIKKDKLVIIDLSSEHWGVDGLDVAYEKFNSLNINFLLLSHEPNDHLKFDRMLYYPHWYHWSVSKFIIPKKISDSKQYLWSCLNSTPRYHRIQNYILSCQKSYYAQAKFSMHDTPRNANIENINNQLLDEHVLNQWNAIKSTLPDRSDIFLKSPGDIAFLSIPELTNSYVHLITETSVLSRVFLTEKTWKPIATKQIFLLFGNPGSIETLRLAGVDVFDDIVDHSYDDEPDWRQRLYKIHQSLEALLQQDLPAIFQRTQLRREQNQLKFKNLQFNLQYQRDLSAAIERYL